MSHAHIVSDQFDWTQTRPSEAVIRLTSAARDCEPTALSPLSEVVDVDALDSYLRSAGTQTTVHFTYAGASVRLQGDGSGAVHG